MGKNKYKKISTRLTYAYLRKIKRWILCPCCQNGKMKINKSSTIWVCENCNYELSVEEFEDDYVFWFCDECGAYLNVQDNFNRKSSKHICQNCGYENDITLDNIKGICSDCGKILSNPDKTLCEDCRQLRIQKARDWCYYAAKVVEEISVVVNDIYLATHKSNNDENICYSPYISDDTEWTFGTKCANCGNSDEKFLWDEGDTIYCSKCCHRTLKETGKDDLVECPYCHRMRDRKAMYCRWCNDSEWLESTADEFKEINKILKDMDS